MSLVVLGGQSLDELQDWVTDLFSSVTSGKGPRPTFFDAGMPYKVCILPCPAVPSLCPLCFQLAPLASCLSCYMENALLKHCILYPLLRHSQPVGFLCQLCLKQFLSM